MTSLVLSDDETVQGATVWFDQFGRTDVSYMSVHWERFLRTREFALDGTDAQDRLVILDVGAHWLHNAFLYANRGHQLICVDAPDLMQTDVIGRAANAMGATIIASRRLEVADGLDQIPESSVDLVLFCEIIGKRQGATA